MRAGRANASMPEGVKVDYYGTHTPVQQVANISTPDARTIAIQPWEKHMLGEIEKAILAANIGLTLRTMVRWSVSTCHLLRKKGARNW